MSHRVLLALRQRTATSLLSLLRPTAIEPLSLHASTTTSSLSYPSLPQLNSPTIQTRNKSSSHKSKTVKSAKSLGRYDNYLQADALRLEQDVLDSLKPIGFKKKEAKLLAKLIHVRCVGLRDARFIHESLKNRFLWLQNETLIPKHYRRPWNEDALEDLENFCQISDLDRAWSDEAMGEACYTLGLYHFDSGFLLRGSAYLAEACCFLEVAVLFGNTAAATALVNIHNDPVCAQAISSRNLNLDARPARTMIRDLAISRDPDVEPSVPLTYLSDEFGPEKIRVQGPNQLQWGLDRLDEIPEPVENFLFGLTPIHARYPYPAQIRLWILDHCLKQRISIPRMSHEVMMKSRQAALEQLAGYNDPFASMSLALAPAPNAPPMFSKEWERLIMAAAGGGDGLALWLLAIHVMQKEGVLPISPKTKARLPRSTGFEYGRLSIIALHDNPGFLTRFTLALAAICRAADDQERGLQVLAQSANEAFDRRDFDRRDYQMLDEVYQEWGNTDPDDPAYWGEKRYGELLTGYCDLNSRRMEEVMRKYRKSELGFAG